VPIFLLIEGLILSSEIDNNLSASLEDYLEAIYNLTLKKNIARSKDIAEMLDVTRSSVTGALRILSDKGLVNYKPYGLVTLTEKGLSQATTIAKKHEIISSFFVDILGVERSVASVAACKSEHALGSQIVDRLLAFIKFVTQESKNGNDLVAQFKTYWQQEGSQRSVETSYSIDKKDEIQLSLVRPGSTVVFKGVMAGEELRSRLASLGMVPNAEITVISNSLRGPFVVSFKGSKIALGKEMTKKVMVIQK